jgi:drug/metabolite transporter (DMT)-like permease
MNWLILSFTGLFSLSIMSFFITLLARKGYPVSFILLGISIVLTIFYFVQTFITAHYKVAFSPSVLGILLFIGILSAIGNVTLYQAANTAPNAGLAIGIVGMQSVVVAILAFMFLKDKMTTLQLIGLMLSVVAIFLMSMGSNNSSDSKQQIAQGKHITTKK